MLVSKSKVLFGGMKMKTEVFFRVKVLEDGVWYESKNTYRSHKEAKQEAEAALYAPDEYKIVRCERKVI